MALHLRVTAAVNMPVASLTAPPASVAEPSPPVALAALRPPGCRGGQPQRSPAPQTRHATTQS